MFSLVSSLSRNLKSSGNWNLDFFQSAVQRVGNQLKRKTKVEKKEKHCSFLLGKTRGLDGRKVEKKSGKKLAWSKQVKSSSNFVSSVSLK